MALYPCVYVKGAPAGQPVEPPRAPQRAVHAAKAPPSGVAVRGSGPGIGRLAAAHGGLEARAGLPVVLVAAGRAEPRPDHGGAGASTGHIGLGRPGSPPKLPRGRGTVRAKQAYGGSRRAGPRGGRAARARASTASPRSPKARRPAGGRARAARRRRAHRRGARGAPGAHALAHGPGPAAHEVARKATTHGAGRPWPPSRGAPAARLRRGPFRSPRRGSNPGRLGKFLPCAPKYVPGHTEPSEPAQR